MKEGKYTHYSKVWMNHAFTCWHSDAFHVGQQQEVRGKVKAGRVKRP